MRLNTNVLRAATNAQEKKNKKDFFLIVADNKNHARANKMEKKKSSIFHVGLSCVPLFVRVMRMAKDLSLLDVISWLAMLS